MKQKYTLRCKEFIYTFSGKIEFTVNYFISVNGRMIQAQKKKTAYSIDDLMNTSEYRPWRIVIDYNLLKPETWI